MRTFIVSLLVLASVSSLNAFSWQACDEGQKLWTPASVSLSPDPPLVGSTVTFTVAGNNDDKVVYAGEVDVSVLFSGTEIFSEVKDLCKTTKSCPIDKGEVDLKYIQELPAIAPPGDYEVHVTVFDDSKVELMCVIVDFTIVAPPALQEVEVKESDKTLGRRGAIAVVDR